MLVLVLLLLSAPPRALQEDPQEMESSEDVLEKDYIYPQPHRRSVSDHTEKCSYTFIVPQQKKPGAICVNSKEPEVLLENQVHKQQLELLNLELQKQRRQIEALQQLLEVDGGIVNEVKLLRKESRNMNSRVTQLYLQLLHEIIRKRDGLLEVSELEARVLNQTNAMGHLSTRYQELEHKYQHLTALAGNQSNLLLQLEDCCQRARTAPELLPPRDGRLDRNERPDHDRRLDRDGRLDHDGRFDRDGAFITDREIRDRDRTFSTNHRDRSHAQMPALSPGGYRPFHPPPRPRHHLNSRTSMTNEIQNDQNPKALPLPTLPSSTHSFTSEPSGESSGPFKDCQQALDEGHSVSGMYLLKPEKANQLLQAWCDMRHDPGGWTVILRRQDGSVNFFRNWDTYKLGFGNIDGEYWLGLENIYALTNQGPYKLLVTLEDWSGRKTFAEYASFRIEPETDFYRLRLGRYHGNAGDSLTWHNGKQFTTLDRDHDAYAGNCAHYQKGGWWYNACAHSNLSGVWYRGGHYRSRYQDGVYWAEFRGGAYSLRRVTMMIRPNNGYH